MNTKLWEKRYQELIEYKKSKGDTNVPRRYEANPQLGVWVSNQRQYFKKYKSGISGWGMTEDRAARLEKLGFEWVLSGGRSCGISGGGVCNGGGSGGGVTFNSISLVTGNGTGHLSNALNVKMNEYGNQRTSLLEIKPGMEWECMYDRLLYYKQVYGGINPSIYVHKDQKLADWVEKQQKEFRMFAKGIKGKAMTLERFQLLVDIGFSSNNNDKECVVEKQEEQNYAANTNTTTKDSNINDLDRDEEKSQGRVSNTYNVGDTESSVNLLDDETKAKVKEILRTRERQCTDENANLIQCTNDLANHLKVPSIPHSKNAPIKYHNLQLSEYNDTKLENNLLTDDVDDESHGFESDEEDEEENAIYFDAIALCGNEATLDTIAAVVLQKYSNT